MIGVYGVSNSWVNLGSGPAWRDICTFKAAPIKKFSFLQLFDLQDDFIQEQIRKPPERPSCSVSSCQISPKSMQTYSTLLSNCIVVSMGLLGQLYS
jgi:hypothetical protein